MISSEPTEMPQQCWFRAQAALQALPASGRQILCIASDAELIDHHNHCLTCAEQGGQQRCASGGSIILLAQASCQHMVASFMCS